MNVFKGDFIKLSTLQIGYNIPGTILSRAKISRFRLYASGQNLAIITKHPGPDPEVSTDGNSTQTQGIDRNTLANGRTLTVGLNVAGLGTSTALINTILTERRIEFLGEGLRNNDLMRLLQTIPAKGAAPSKSPTDEGYIWPASSDEKSLNKLWVDN